MQNEKKIKALAEGLRKKYESCDPFVIAKALGIELRFAELGSLKGFYVLQHRIPYIVLNNSLDYDTSRIVCAHELGHDRLHKKIAASRIFNDFELFLVNNKAEHEADSFAAHLLISDEEAEDAAKKDRGLCPAASSLCISPELLKIKLTFLEGSSKHYGGSEDGENAGSADCKDAPGS